MRGWQILLAFFLLAPRIARGGEQGGGAVDEIVGTWSGSSLCVDRKAAPGCNDEQVIYDIRANPGKPNTVTVDADKVVDGKRAPMGALEFVHDPKSGTWTSEFDSARFHAVWRVTVNGSTMTGSLTLLPSNAVTRKLDLRKAK